MSDIVEFVLRIKDYVSGGMAAVATNTTASLNTVDNSISKTSQKFYAAGKSVNDLNKRIDDLKKQRDVAIGSADIRRANREIDDLQRKVDHLTNSGGTSAPRGMRLPWWLGIGAMAAATGGGLLSVANTGMQGDASRMRFETMAGQKQGNKLYTDLTKFAQDSIFGNELYKNAQTMLAFGIATDKVMPSLRMLGDVSMGDKERLAALSLAFSQTTSAGKLMGQDLLQYVNAGFNPLQVMAEKTGKKMSDLRDNMSDGKITVDMVRKSLEWATSEGGRFYQMTEKIGQTPFGKWEAFKGQLDGIALTLGTKLLPTVSMVTDLLSRKADVIVPTLVSIVNNGVIPLVHWLASSAEWLSNNWYWLKVAAGGIATLRIGMIAFTETVKMATLVNTAFNLSLETGPWGLVIGLVAAAAAGLGLFALNSKFAADKVNTTLAGGIADNKLTDVYANAGKKNAEAYSKGFNDIAIKAQTEGPEKYTPGRQPRYIADGMGSFKENPDYKERSFFQKAADWISDIRRQGSNSGLTGMAPIAYGVQKKANNVINMPKGGMVEVADASKKTLPAGGSDISSLDSSTDKITGGGKRPINIYNNKPFVENFTIQTQHVEQGYEQLKSMVGQIFLEILNSAASAK